MIRADVESVIPIPNPQSQIPAIMVFFEQNVPARLQFEFLEAMVNVAVMEFLNNTGYGFFIPTNRQFCQPQ